METPASVHVRSKIPFPERIKEYEYPSHTRVMNVRNSGSIRWKSYYWVYLSRVLIGRRLGIEEIGNGIWKVYYRDVILGYFSEKDIREKLQSTRLSPNLV
jgi:hypothetical protein